MAANKGGQPVQPLDGDGAQPAAGEVKSWTTSLLQGASKLVQSFKPINAICQHLSAFHFYAHDQTRHVESHHYCHHLSEQVRQCVIYEDNTPNARLIGVEYIITRDLFEALPPEEKVFWHSHVHEVRAGLLQAHGVPTAAEDVDMNRVVDTYGKTIHTWQVDRGDALPLGPPQLMMSYVSDAQIPGPLVTHRDRRLGCDTAASRAHRATAGASMSMRDQSVCTAVRFPATVAEGADHPSHTGQAWQLALEQVPLKK